MSALYREITIWKRLDDTKAVKFNCLEKLNAGQFGVLSADFYYYPPKPGSFEYFQKQFLELFLETNPDERIETWHSSIEEAISHHETEFS